MHAFTRIVLWLSTFKLLIAKRESGKKFWTFQSIKMQIRGKRNFSEMIIKARFGGIIMVGDGLFNLG